MEGTDWLTYDVPEAACTMHVLQDQRAVSWHGCGMKQTYLCRKKEQCICPDGHGGLTHEWQILSEHWDSEGRPHTEAKCPHRKVACPLECGDTFQQCLLEPHMTNSCPHRLVPCDLLKDPSDAEETCGAMPRFCDLQAHKANECPHRVVSAAEGCTENYHCN